jgi:uncharacterized protein with HEPN domain
MPAERRFVDYLNDILDNARELKAFVAGLSLDEFRADVRTQYAVIRAAEIIGEATKRIQHRPSGHRPDVPYQSPGHTFDQ